jgi:hypothetical protein
MAAAAQHRALPTRTPPATAQFASRRQVRAAPPRHIHRRASAKLYTPHTGRSFYPVRVWCILYGTPTIRFGRSNDDHSCTPVEVGGRATRAFVLPSVKARKLCAFSSISCLKMSGHSQFEQPVQLQRHRCFPDPDPPHSQEALLADDVSGFNGLCPAYTTSPESCDVCA